MASKICLTHCLSMIKIMPFRLGLKQPDELERFFFIFFIVQPDQKAEELEMSILGR